MAPKNKDAAAAALPADAGAEEKIAALQAQVKDLQKQLKEAKAELDRRFSDQKQDFGTLDQQLVDAREKAAQQTRLSAKRLIQIAAVERQLEAEREKNEALVNEVVKQTQMMDRVLSFRDQETARDMAQLTNTNIKLRDKLEVWHERAEELQQERWTFVARFRKGDVPGGGGGGAQQPGGGGGGEDEDSDDDEDGGDQAEEDDDW